MITREADYAMRAIVYLCHNSDGYVGSAVLSEEMDIPYRFLKKIVRRLVEVDLVESVRGKNGGIKLARPASEITFYELINAFDPKAMKLNNCCAPDLDGCERSDDCCIHESLWKIQGVIDEKLKEVTFDQL